MEDKVSGLPRFNDRFGMWKHLLNHVLVTKTLGRPREGQDMVLNGQPYSQYPAQIYNKYNFTCRTYFS